ncbi:MAG: ABC transporter permease [Mesorhizobium sp.]|nr:MAG: ABC transporter permease [Mesorhizobium sp.]
MTIAPSSAFSPKHSGDDHQDEPFRESPHRERAQAFAQDRVAVGALAVLMLLVVVAVFAPAISAQDPYDLSQFSVLDNMLPPGAALADGRIAWLGTDDQGRDMLSAIIYGLRISLIVGGTSVVIACLIGATVGIFATYAGGRTEAAIMRVVDLQLSFPAILVALVLLSAFGRGIDKVILALVVVQWAYFARMVRGSGVVERRKEYIEAAQCLALPRSRIVFRHLLPNCLAPLIVVATIDIARAIALEATLSFLGVGVPVTEPSLGALINKGYNYLLSGDYWISIFPGIALATVIVAVNLVGDRLRDVLNPRLGVN